MELILVEGVDHATARQRYQEVDVFVDQLYAGWYGGLAVEAMALGKPVLVYIRYEDLDFIPEAMRRDLPFVQVTTESLQDRLREVVHMPRSALHELGRRSRKFVESWHNPREIAGQMKSAYEAALLRRLKGTAKPPNGQQQTCKES